MKHIPSSLFRLIGGLIVMFLMYGCSSSFYLSTMHHDPIYGPEEVVLTVPSDVKIDTLSYSQFKWKLRTDFNFRYDYAQFAMNQPLSWYNRNFTYSYWRPFTSFDVYWNRHNYWYDWAFNYPFNYGWGYNSFGWNNWNYGWGYWNHWNRPSYHWNNWYNGPWHNPSYNVIWNSSRENTMISYNRGRRGSRFIDNGNSNIENTISTRYNKPRNNNINIDDIVRIIRNGNDEIPVRVYNNPNNVIIRNNNNVINNSRPVVPNNNSIRGSWRPSNNNSINNSRPVYNNSNSTNISRGSSNVSRGSSSSSSSGRSSGGSSGGSSRGSNNRN